MIRPWLAVLVLGGCGATAPRAGTAETIAPERCAAVMQERFAIDASPEPRVCVPLFEAIASLGPRGAEAARGLVIVRDRRGRCGDRCPDLASALMSDATLAMYVTRGHALHVTDATFEGPRWKGPEPSAVAVAAYLEGLGLDGPGLVARVRALPGVTLPPGPLEAGDERVLDAIVRAGPRILLGSEAALADLLRHELGHAIQLHGEMSGPIHGWSRLTGWTESEGEVADGFIGGGFESERPIVASRLILGLPRGDANYLPAPSGTPTGYAAFDPMEDFAESVRLAVSDPRALARSSPVRLLAAGTPEALADREVRVAIAPAVRALLASEDGPYAMRVLERLGPAILPEAAPLADARPLPWPADATASERADFAAMRLVITIGGHTFRPTDAAFLAMLQRLRVIDREIEELQQGLDP